MDTTENGHMKSGKVKHARRLIGIRLLFPSLDGMSITDKCHTWVERHKNKYFLGWSKERLEEVEAVVRPLDVITPELYKLHMNRNEFNRMKYLQFCLETNEPWAEEFRNKLAKTPDNGGFAGLNQAKVVATDLWRQHSADYRSCLANTVKLTRSSQSVSPDEISAKKIKLENSMCSDWSSSNPSADDVRSNDSSLIKFGNLNETCPYGAMDLRQSSVVKRTGIDKVIKTEQEDCNEKLNKNICSDDGSTTEVQYGLQDVKHAHTDSIKQLDNFVSNILGSPNDASDKDGSESKPRAYTTYTTPVFPYNSSMEVSSYYTPPSVIQHHTTRSTSSPEQSINDSTKEPSESEEYQPLISSNTTVHSRSSRRRDWKWAPKSWRGKHGSNTEWKKSERGMSFLFPSISDQPLTLWEKVNIIVMRHKNNYFLEWTDELLKDLDPLVRPKVIVTKERYKEYCHRNAMKYDSNLQFSMEATDDWAEKFRARLLLEPEQGGFSNMCHVRSEAGRLWREHSGKYRHRNVVKENMDMNESRTGNVDQETSSLPALNNLPSNVHFNNQVNSQHGGSPVKQLFSHKVTHAPRTLPVLPFHSELPQHENPAPQYENFFTNNADGIKRRQGGRLNKVINRLAVLKSTTEHREKRKPNGLLQPHGSYGLEKNEAIDWLWSCREMLHNACRDDPAASWHGRLRPYLHIFKERLGGDYEFPTSVSGCVADLVLILLDGEIQSTNFV